MNPATLRTPTLPTWQHPHLRQIASINSFPTRPEAAAVLQALAKEFPKMVRENNPGSLVLWVEGVSTKLQEQGYRGQFWRLMITPHPTASRGYFIDFERLSIDWAEHPIRGQRSTAH